MYFSILLNMRIGAFAMTAPLLCTVAIAAPVKFAAHSDELEDVFFARGPDDTKNIKLYITDNIKEHIYKPIQGSPSGRPKNRIGILGEDFQGIPVCNLPDQFNTGDMSVVHSG